jgi:hypothetical protein
VQSHHLDVSVNARALSPLLALLLFVSAPACGGGGDGNPDPDGGHEGDQGGSDLGGEDQGGSEDAGGDDAGGDMGGGDASDVTAPVAGASGTLTASNPTSSTVDLSWSFATDETTAGSALEYRAYFSLADNLDTVALVLANGTAANEWQANFSELTVESLALDQPYYFNVLVRDEAGNVAAYNGASATTLNGAWQDEEPLEDFTGGSVYYSTFVTSPAGDVAVHWTQQGTWNAHFATRGRTADTFGDPAPWGAPGTYTQAFVYGFDGSLVGAGNRNNLDGTSDVVFATYSEGEALVFEVVAGSLVSDYLREQEVCVAENGDVMVAWIDGTSDDAFSVRARFRTGDTWGTPVLVSGSEGLGLYGLDVVCSSDGDHVLLYGEDDGSARALVARVYDASEGAWHAAPLPLGDDDYQYRLATARTPDGRLVVGFEEYDEADMTRYLRARTYSDEVWSTTTTFADSDPVSVSDLRLAAAGNDIHAIWRSGSDFVASRLEAGSTAWTTATPVATVAGVQEFCVAGDPFGRVQLAWVANNAINARLYRDAWGSEVAIKAASQFIGSGSLSCVIDARKRASVAWTLWDPTAMQFSAFARTFR